MTRPSAILAAGALLGMAPFAQPADLDDMIEKIDGNIASSIQAYNDFLDATGQEKLDLIAHINELESETIAQRDRERELANEAKRSEIDLEGLQDQLASAGALATYTRGVLSDYLSNFESRIHLAEDQAFADQLAAIRASLEDEALSPQETLELYLSAVDRGLARQEKLVGGYVFEGRAITRSGGVKSGQIALLGPVAYFRGEDGQTAGLLRFNSGTLEPGLNEFDAATSSAIRQFIETGQGLIPLDASLGKAISLDRARGTLIDHIKKGGWVGYSIILLGFVAIGISVVKASDLKASRTAAPEDLQPLAETAADEPEKALRETESLPPPTGDTLRAAIRNLHMSEEFLMDSVTATILKHRPRFERFLPFLATIAAVAPLLGLLGTVVGMIKTFTLITVFGTGDAKSLSSGISEALVTTELGLIVAIPALIVHGAFARMSRSRVAAMERAGADFVTAALSRRAKHVA